MEALDAVTLQALVTGRDVENHFAETFSWLSSLPASSVVDCRFSAAAFFALLLLRLKNVAVCYSEACEGVRHVGSWSQLCVLSPVHLPWFGCQSLRVVRVAWQLPPVTVVTRLLVWGLVTWVAGLALLSPFRSRLG